MRVSAIVRLVAGMACLLALLAQGQATAAAEENQPYSEAGADTCLGCHNSPDMLVIFGTAHGQQADPAAPMASLQCEACHGPAGLHTGRRQLRAGHTAVTAFGPDAATLPEDQVAACLNCHREDVNLAWSGSAHERNEALCSACHRVHTARDPVLSQTNQNEICFDCHREQKSASMKPSSHPLRTEGPVRVAAMACSDCHSPHSSGSFAGLVRDTGNQVCFECHAEFRGPMLFEHAPVSEDCLLCHDPHGSIHAPMLVQRPPLLCQSCHSQSGHPSVSFTEQGLAGGNPSSMVLQRSCLNCHTQVHGSNHPSGYKLMR
jgi:DmsE family decaheme c-type cytochrome